jgi:hypothetical protein
MAGAAAHGSVLGPYILPHLNALSGRGNGQFTPGPGNPNGGVSDQLTGVGHFGRLGDVTITGSLEGVGSAGGRATGTLTLVGATGSVTIQLLGRAQGANAALPSQWSYVVTGGTGILQGLSGHGTLSLVTLPQGNTGSGSFSIAI